VLFYGFDTINESVLVARLCIQEEPKVLKYWDGRAWTGLIWLRIGTGGGLL
jgi:hypothetical protein